MDKLVSIDALYFLIQTVRANQALMEAGVPVGIPKKHMNIYNHLRTYFTYDVQIGQGETLDAEICHSTPFVRIGDLVKPLLYPHELVYKYKASWAPRDIKFFFQGLVPKHRKSRIDEWRGKAVIIDTDVGRKSLKRFWDPAYVTRMGKSQFVLCPKGGFNWSYRFYEAVLCGATPIISDYSPLYEGYHFHHWDDKTFKRKHVESNFELAKTQLTASKQELLDNIRCI